MRVYKSKWFARFARKETVTDEAICSSVRNAEQGIVDADYGGGVIKQRVSRLDEVKSGGYRIIMIYRRGHRSIFVYGFAKNDQANIDESDERDFKALAKILLAAPDAEFEKLVNDGKFVEVVYDDRV